jgi:hypothetical protein
MEAEATTKKVTLWTRQDKKSLEELKSEGIIRIKKKHIEEKFDQISDYIIFLYKWFVVEASKRVRRPDGVEFPIWCSVSEEYMLRPTENEIVYVLEVDEADIIYFDGQKWDYVLNHHYIPRDEEDGSAYEKEIAEKGFRDSYIQPMIEI